MASINLDLTANFTQSSGPCEIPLDNTMPKITDLLTHTFSWEGTGWASSYTMNFYADNINEYTKFLVYERLTSTAARLDSSHIDRLTGANKIIVTVDNWASTNRGTAYITLVVQDANGHIERQSTKNADFTNLSLYCETVGIFSITNISLTANITFSQNIPFTIYGGGYADRQIGTGQFIAGSGNSTITLDEEKAKELLPTSNYIQFVPQPSFPAGKYTFTLDYVAYVKKHVIYVDEYQGGIAQFMCTVKYYDGTKFVPCYPHYYDGTQWNPCDQFTQVIIT